MKLERISENQIRCTLTRSDLADRELKLSELAYGTEKAKALFRDMMLQASDELGFEADNIPLIIEAIPVSNECIMLIVTKVEDPEELDTRFSKFTPFSDDTDTANEDDSDDIVYTGAEDILDIFKRLSSDIIAKHIEKQGNNPLLSEDTEEALDVSQEEEEDQEQKPTVLSRIYEFKTLEDVTNMSLMLPEQLECGNSLYKNPINSHFYLIISNAGMETSSFKKVCRIASEFGTIQKASANTLYYYDEHYELIIKDRALQILRSL